MLSKTRHRDHQNESIFIIYDKLLLLKFKVRISFFSCNAHSLAFEGVLLCLFFCYAYSRRPTKNGRLFSLILDA